MNTPEAFVYCTLIVCGTLVFCIIFIRMLQD